MSIILLPTTHFRKDLPFEQLSNFLTRIFYLKRTDNAPKGNGVARLAQLVEHQTFNLRVKGSSPLSGVLILFCNIKILQ